MSSQGPGNGSTSMFGSTFSPASDAAKPEIPRFLALTVLAHPDVRRVGDRVTLPQLTSGRPIELSRLAPGLGPPTGEYHSPLLDKHLSRRPLQLVPVSKAAGGIVIHRGEMTTGIEVDGVEVTEECLVTPRQLESGVTLVLARRVTLLLHFFVLESRGDVGDLGLVGESSAITVLRREIRQVAPHSVTVLIQGETGTGKELVAQAIHHAGPRAKSPLISINMGALPPTLAAAELFGAVPGGYTGAEKRIGVFEQANGGTLFLDEIGETPEEAQVMLLRALETMEIQPVGASFKKKVDVHIVAATDASLQAAVLADRFRAPLLHRLAGYELTLPSLRERRDDFGRLLFHFLQEELDAIDQGHLLQPVSTQQQPWLSATLVAQLARFSWPGNVRQLHNAAKRLVVGGIGGSADGLERVVEQILYEPETGRSPSGRSPSARSAPQSYRSPHEVTDDELSSVLKAQRWNLKAAARELGISRGSLYVLIDRSPTLRRASDLTPQEIRECHERHQGDLDSMSDELEVSRYALQHRLRQLDR